MRLAGEHVQLRTMTALDAPMTLRWRQSPRAILLNRGARSVEGQAEWIVLHREDFNFIIELFDGTPVGMLCLSDINQEHKHASSSHFLIGEEEKCKGIPVAAEAMLLLYRFAFDDLGLHRVWGHVASDNIGMIRWQKYLGMVEEGRMTEHLFINGHWQDAVILGLTAQRFETVARPKLEAMCR